MLFDRPATLNPDDVLEWHAVCVAGIAKERRDTLNGLNSLQPLPQYISSLIGATLDEVETYFDACREELDLSAILTLVAAAEARIRLDARNRTNAVLVCTLSGRLRTLIAGARSEWSVPLYEDGILDAWKQYVSTQPFSANDISRIKSRIGKLKEVLNVRHWVAHGRYWQLSRPVSDYPPNMVATTIDRLYASLASAAANTIPFK